MKTLVVIAHYNEDIEWVQNSKIECRIVSKTLAESDIYQSENRGNESSSYLAFITKNYYILTKYDKLIFLHGHRASWHQRYDSDFLINNIDFRLVENYLNLNDEYYYEIFPDRVVSSGKVGYVGDNKTFLILKEVWNQLFLEELGEQPDYIGMIPGAQFIVDTKLILRRSKGFYEKLLNWLISDESHQMDLRFGGNGNTYSSRVLEWTWNKILCDSYLEKQKNVSLFFTIKH